jgi:thioredoxin-related protein
MKKFIILLLLIFLFNCAATNKFNITIVVNINDDKIEKDEVK